MAGFDEQCECPLCMEPLEIDDISFYPCTCGYQICRFCWHRIRTDENGLCPACRKQYSEDPAEFKPLTEDELQRIKKERRQKDVQRKQKAAESRKHLANVRVVQRNLVFVVGLSQRLADPDQLKKLEYFGKFGKIHKVVINQSTSYAGAQGPSASAYVTYCKSTDALKAILNVNNIHIDGRTLKASLGTTKYCSHFLKGTQCQKMDCMYLHELGEEAASFTKEEMQMGKHQEYEQKLLQQFQNSQQTMNNHKNKKGTSPVTVNQTDPQQAPPPPPVIPVGSDETSDGHTCWPTLNKNNAPDAKPNPANPRAFTPPDNLPQTAANPRPRCISDNTGQRNPSPPKACDIAPQPQLPTDNSTQPPSPPKPGATPQLSPRGADAHTVQSPRHAQQPPPPQMPVINRRSLVFDNSNNHSLSLFSGDGFTPRLPQNAKAPVPQTTVPSEAIMNPSIPDTQTVTSTTDWQAAFGFSKTPDYQDDDLGFDPLEESAKGLADLIQKEKVDMNQHQFHNSWHGQPHPFPNYPSMPPLPHGIPPAFAPSYPNHMFPNPLLRHDLNMNGSRMMGLMNLAPSSNADIGRLNSFSYAADPAADNANPQIDAFGTKDWQDGLRALLPNINISFGAPSTLAQTQTANAALMQNSDIGVQQWVKSVHSLTDTDNPLANHRLPFVQQLSLRGAAWPPQTRNPPPGFQNMPSAHSTESHTVMDPLQ